MNRLSKITVWLGIYIIISASFMNQLNSFLTRTFGIKAVKFALLFTYFLLVVFYTLYISRKKLPISRIVISLFVFILAFFYLLWQPYIAEQLHIFEYGILGYLALKDLLLPCKRNLKSILFALFFVTLVGALDEGFQKILPYRTFDPRDIATNATSGFLGSIQYLVYRSRYRYVMIMLLSCYLAMGLILIKFYCAFFKTHIIP
ncbi:MAG: hypothetical protein A2Z72_01915 [Omnitrophica bacterium RBG_13_46_9]|nr:MAG: hypothetical protein A2Z72_01915 [Omnitrophica bacterium RBG_13_46_9]